MPILPGQRPFFGGSAADNSIEGKWLLYADGKSFADGFAAAAEGCGDAT